MLAFGDSMPPAGGQAQVQDVIVWVQRHPAWAAAIAAAVYPAALVLRPLLIQALPYLLLIFGLAVVRHPAGQPPVEFPCMCLMPARQLTHSTNEINR